MSRAQWLASLSRRGVRVYLAGDELRVRGRMSMRDKSRLERDASGVRRLLRERKRRREQRVVEAEPVDPQPARRVVGQRCVGRRGDSLEWEPLFRDQTRDIQPSGAVLRRQLWRIGELLGAAARPAGAWPVKRRRARLRG